MNMNSEKMKAVFTVVERSGKSFWTRVGVGFVNRDGSITLKLDAVPVNGTLQVREWEDREARPQEGAPMGSFPRMRARDGVGGGADRGADGGAGGLA